MTESTERLGQVPPTLRHALAEHRARAAEIGAETVEVSSDDGTLRVTATLHGRIVDVHLLPGTASGVDRCALAERIADTCRAAQRHAAERYREKLDAELPPEYAEYRRLMGSLLRN